MQWLFDKNNRFRRWDSVTHANNRCFYLHIVSLSYHLNGILSFRKHNYNTLFKICLFTSTSCLPLSCHIFIHNCLWSWKNIVFHSDFHKEIHHNFMKKLRFLNTYEIQNSIVCNSSRSAYLHQPYVCHQVAIVLS